MFLTGLALAAGMLVPAQEPQVTRPPRLVSQPQVELDARRMPEEDTSVLLVVTVDETGEVTRVDVQEGAKADLDQAAMGAACSFSFEPAEVDGVPAPIQIQYRYRFAGKAKTPAAAVVLPVDSPPAGVVASETEPELASLGGRVVDDRTGAGIPDVELFLQVQGGDSQQVMGDENGRFTIPGILPGRHVLAVTATGFETLSVEEEFLPGENVQVSYALRSLNKPAFETVVQDSVRRQARVSLVVGSVSQVTEKDLQLMAPQSANEVLRKLPGVNVVDEDGAGLRPNIGLRGMDPNRSRKVLVLEDGAPIALAPYGEPEMYYAPAIERMKGLDVAKGADSILHGPQTIGGVINYLTVDPPKQLKVINEARLGNFGYWMGHVAAGNTMGPVGFRLDVIHRRFVGPRHLNLQMVDVSGKVRMEFTPSSVLTLKAGAYSEDSNATYLGLTTPQYQANPWANPAIHDRFIITRYNLSGNHDHVFSRWLKLSTLFYANTIQRNWARQEYDRKDNGLDYERVITGSPGAAPDNDGGSLYFKNANVFRNRKFTVVGLEPRLVLGRWSLGPSDHDVILGARVHLEQAAEQRLEGSSGGATTGNLVEDDRRAALAFAFYGQYRITLFDSLRITPGLRVENILQSRNTLRTRLATANGLLPVDVNTFETTPTVVFIPGVGASYLLLDGLMFFAGIHRGYAPPRIKDAITPEGANLELAPELSWNLEAGTRLNVRDVFMAEAALYHIDFENQVIPPSESGGATSSLPGSSTPRLINGGRTEHSGFEGTTSLDIAKATGWNFSVPIGASYTYSRAVFTDGIFKGNRLPYAPEHMLSARIQFIHPLGFEGQLSGSYTSPQFTDNTESKVPSMDGTTGVIGRRFLVDARVAYLFKPLGLSFSLAGKNLTDFQYISGRAPQGIQPGVPRQVMVGVRGEM